MLMQIAEPGQSQIKEACKTRVVGIDLGTTNSLVAYVRDGAPVAIGEGQDALVPSVVRYDVDGRVVVGRAAMASANGASGAAGSTTISSVKRLVGRSTGDISAIRGMLPYKLIDDDRMVKVAVGERQLTPVEISAEILRELKRRAEAFFGEPVDSAVITVPAYFDDAQRQATRDAGRLAGLEVLRLLAEPTAAALAYGIDKQIAGTYAVYDLGGGTFDISILKLVDGVFEVKATGGDSALGGDDIDRALAAYLLAQAGGGDINHAVNVARAAKEALSAADSTSVTVQSAAGATTTLTLTRAQLADVAAPLLATTAKACRRALRDAETTADALDGVILVGGSTRSPVVRAAVADIFGREPLADVDPDQVVALGAALQAEMLAGHSEGVVLLDVIPLSLGIETMGGVVEKLIHRNTTMPAGATQQFTTYADNQTGFDLHVLQGERETVDGCRSLARFKLSGVPPMVAGMARVDITFQVDANGILTVKAHEQTSGVEASVDVKPTYGLTDEEVERMLVESFEFAEDDLRRRNLATERIEAKRILAATQTAMVGDAALLTAEVKVATDAAIAALQATLAGDNYLAIRAAIEALDHASKPFAEIRMNLAIAKAMAGKRVEEVEEGYAEGHIR
ncbi:MAG: Fe-S protein assembly chaperone HscA [Myxococcales bacterium]|nr:Fe-S protein assembly chaperone HscA [Myxococcales bacterium]